MQLILSLKLPNPRLSKNKSNKKWDLLTKKEEYKPQFAKQWHGLRNENLTTDNRKPFLSLDL